MSLAARSRLHLASRSPRRAMLLEEAGIPFVLGPFPDVDETAPPGLEPWGIAEALAARKARAVLPRMPSPAPGGSESLCLAADTLVFIGSRILGKPLSAEDAAAALRQLSGRTHGVTTGVAIARGDQLVGGAARTWVTFRDLDDPEIDRYVATGEPLDKAGSYGIQGGAAGFVERVEGDLDTVIGLPLRLVHTLLARVGETGLRVEGPGGR